MNKKYIAGELLNKYRSGTCTDEEKAIVESWHLQQLADKKSEVSENELEVVEERIWSSLPENEEQSGKNYLWRYSAAASVLIVFAASLYLLISNQNKQNKSVKASIQKQVGAPGENKAILILADGSQIILDNAKEGNIASQLNASVSKLGDGTLIYDLQHLEDSVNLSNINTAQLYNTLSVPRGGQYQIILPDGTKVWMNSVSSLRFPVIFAGKERIVELSGEAYFEVARNKDKPFKVVTDKQTVEVLGTHFNINAYEDESDIRTTLFEGSVNVVSGSDKTMIKPGQQTVVTKNGNAIKVQKADLNATLAWKNGYFEFKNEKIESIMRKVARWYDVDVVYKMGYTRQTYVGSISKFENVSKVLTMLELTGTTNLKLEGRRIIVMP